MKKDSKIYIAGHNGLVGSAITKCLEQKGYNNFVFRTLKELDLIDQKSVDSFFSREKPDYVFLAAAMVGGIMANNTLRADFMYNNLMIQSNVLNASWKSKVKKLLFLGSTCIYPKNAPQPLREEYLLTSPLEFTNEPYAIAKIAGLKMCESFNIQYNTNFISVMPTNLYGPGDNYNLEKSHVLPALLRKIHLGKCLEDGDMKAVQKDLERNPVENVNGHSGQEDILNILEKYGVQVLEGPAKISTESKPYTSQGVINKVVVNVWGTGTPLREFMYSPDMAAACVFVMENVEISDIIRLNQQTVSQTDYHPSHFLNIGTEEEVTIKELAERIKKLTGFKGEIVFDLSKPDGTMRKTVDVRLLKGLGYKHEFNLEEGLRTTYTDYLK